jgi:hypothetical protein
MLIGSSLSYNKRWKVFSQVDVSIALTLPFLRKASTVSLRAVSSHHLCILDFARIELEPANLKIYVE